MVLTRATAASFGGTVTAVSVGVGALPDNWLPHLPAPENEARAIAEALQRPEGCGVPAERVAPALVGAAATRRAVLDRLGSAIAGAALEDTVFFYFAGHGMATETDFYLCTADAQPADLARTAISGSDIGSLVKTASCRGILVILDCCYSAAAVEHAPAGFSVLRTGEFRLLVASARAGQQSWETTDGTGTLFSRTLTEILQGSRILGRGDGAIYFSDLAEGLQAGVEEKRSERRGSPQQDMIFGGTYTGDPLVLVMRGQTLEAVGFKTARYSPHYVRQALAKTVVALTAAVFFAVVSWYGVLDALQYVGEEGGRLVAFRGHPRYSLPGYPQPIWTYTFGPERLAAKGEARTLPIVAALGQPVAPLVESRLDPLVLASERHDAGDHRVAREIAQALFQDSTVPFETQLGARLLFTEVADEQDIRMLERWSTDERSEVRLAAMRGLLRLDPRHAVDRILIDVSANLLRFNHADLLRRIEGQCSPELERYLRSLTAVRGTSPSISELIDAAVRIGCQLDEAFLLAAAGRLQLRDANSLAGYAIWTGLATHEQVRRPIIPDHWRRIAFQAYLPNVGCDPTWATVLSAGKSPALVAAILATARHCPNVQLEVRWTSIIDLVQLTLNRDGGEALSFPGVFEGSGGAATLVTYLPLLRQLAPREPDRVRATIVLSTDSELRAALLDLLGYWGDRKGLFTDLLDSNDINLRRAFADYDRTANPSSLAEGLLERIGRTDLFYTSLLGRMPLTAKVKSRLETMLTGTREERRAAACVLAMQASVAEVVALITNIDADVRSDAADCTPYNEAASIIAKSLPHSRDGFPISNYAYIQEQVQRKLRFQAQLDALPADLRSWRLAVADTTPGQFGIWGRGMRDWIAEQRYQTRSPSAGARSQSKSSAL